MGVALVASYVLVLQVLVGAFALGAAAAAPMLDVFGNPICITSTASVETDTDRSTHSAIPDCCSVACSMFAPVTADARAPHWLSNPRVPATLHRTAPSYAVAPDEPFDHQPGNPRAPPLTV
jgi:hypothetical protein